MLDYIVSGPAVATSEIVRASSGKRKTEKGKKKKKKDKATNQIFTLRLRDKDKVYATAPPHLLTGYVCKEPYIHT